MFVCVCRLNIQAAHHLYSQLHDEVNAVVVLEDIAQVDCIQAETQLLHNLHLIAQLQKVPERKRQGHES